MKVLIANRGEIARRIQATCHACGIQTIAIYTDEDRFSSYVFHAYESYKLPQNGFKGYLDQQAIIDIAHKAQATAIHPGYGFLAEHGDFAQYVIDQGFTWIGPHPAAIKLLGNKARAQHVMTQAGIATIPGTAFTSPQGEQAKAYALKIGFPILIKCADGGGGKGMRTVEHIEQFESAWNLVVSEAQAQFHSDTLLVEKKILQARHVEVQIAGDGEHFIHFYERECSIQRRHQKIIEEAPCSFISEATKQKLYHAALVAAKAVSYTNIGTVEFLVTPEEDFYFLEINTRLQVEHSVTEFVTGTDLVQLQLSLASKNSLPLQPGIRGHAIECRVYAENPFTNFTPSTGKILNLVLPSGPFLRVDHDLTEGLEITHAFDPMLLKLTTYASNRLDAIGHLRAALDRTNIFGLDTNVPFLQNLLQSPRFLSGDIHTQLLQDSFVKACLASSSTANLDDVLPQIAQYLQSKFLQKAQQKQQSSKITLWRRQQWF